MFSPQNGMAGMLKAMGLDPDELKTNVEGFMAGMRDQAAKINANQERLEAQGGRLETRLDAIAETLELPHDGVGGDLGARLEAKLDAITMKLDEILPIQTTREIFEDGRATGVLITSERFPQAMIDDVNGGLSDGGEQHSDG